MSALSESARRFIDDRPWLPLGGLTRPGGRPAERIAFESGLADLETALDWPAEGICFDVERNGFWLTDWGVRPLDSDEASTIAREHIADAPTLIPIYSHRYISEQPAEAGNPVMSIHQTDITYYGRDLDDYLDREFNPRRARGPVVDPSRRVPFWSELVS